MLGAAGAAALPKYQPEVCAVGISSIWQVANVMRRGAIVIDADCEKFCAYLAPLDEAAIRKRIPAEHRRAHRKRL